MAVDPVARQVYVATPGNSTRIRRFSTDAPGSVDPVVLYNETGCPCAPRGLALDVAHDRVYFSQATPTFRISYALLSSPTTVVDLVDPLGAQLFAGRLERDPSAGTLGELYGSLSASREIVHCSLDAGCRAPPGELRRYTAERAFETG